jgi:hypothetical protein
LKKLDQESERLTVLNIGKSSEGRNPNWIGVGEGAWEFCRLPKQQAVSILGAAFTTAYTRLSPQLLRLSTSSNFWPNNGWNG